MARRKDPADGGTYTYDEICKYYRSQQLDCTSDLDERPADLLHSSAKFASGSWWFLLVGALEVKPGVSFWMAGLRHGHFRSANFATMKVLQVFCVVQPGVCFLMVPL